MAQLERLVGWEYMTDQFAVQIPAEVARRGKGLPSQCARHGRPASRHVDFALQSRTRAVRLRPSWSGLVDLADRLGQHAQAVRVIRVIGWPLCATCVRTRRRWLGISFVLLLGGIIAVAFAAILRSLSEPSVPIAIAFVAGIAGILVSPFTFCLGSLPRLTKARTSADGRSIVITNPHPFFDV